MAVLLVDIGNTRTKSALDDGTALTPLPTFASGDDAALSEWCAALPREGTIERLLVASVAAREVAAALGAAVARHCGVIAELAAVAPQYGDFVTHYDDPAQLGVDRWLAALAAWHDCRDAACVIDAGTALTVDVVDRDGGHLGGLIAPGLALMADSLTRGTAQLLADGFGHGEGLATNTREAIALGCTEAVRGLLATLGERLALDAATHPARWYLTGGGAADILALGVREWRHDPQLVLRGLAVLARH